MEDGNEEKWEAAEEGAELLAEGEVDEAIAVLTALTEGAPDNEYAFFFLGNAFYEKADYPRALTAFVRALELSPQYVGARLGAGHALRMVGELDRALRMARHVLSQNDRDPDALYLAGCVQFTQGEGASARAYLQRFLDTGPEAEVRLEVQGMLQVLEGEVLPFPEGEDGLDRD